MRIRQFYILMVSLVAGLAIQAAFALPALATTYEAQGIATSTNLLATSPALSLDSFHYNIDAIPGDSSVRIQFSKDNSSWYSSAGTLNAWTTLTTTGGADVSLAAFVTASSWTSGNGFYYKMELNSTTDFTQTPAVENIRLDYAPLAGSGGFVFDNSGNVGIGTFSPAARLSVIGTETDASQLVSFSNGNGDNVFSMLSNGNLGIGDATPAALFTVGASDAFQVNSSGAIAAVTGYTQGSGNFAISGAGTFGTGTGTVSLNGNTTIAADKNLTMTSGIGVFSQTYTGTGNALTVTASTATGNAGAIIANSLTTGAGFDISSTSIDGGASGVSKLLNLSRSGANANASHTAYGLYSAVANTGTTSTNVGGYFSASGATNNYGLIVAAGNVGIGTAAPGSKLTVAGSITLDNTTVVSGALADAPATGTCAGQANSASQAVFQTSTSVTSSHIFYNSTRSKHARITSAATCVDGSANTWQILTLTDSITGNAAADSYTVYNPAGDAGTTVAGFINNLYAINGKFVAATVSGGFDIAEEYQTNDESIEAGDTVSIDPNNPLFIAKSSASYDKKLLGIISTNPGLSLGNETIGAWRKVALSGRVATKVSLENGPIAIGDYLTSSSEPGVAMRATAPGMVVGMALEAYDGSQTSNSEIPLNPPLQKGETKENPPLQKGETKENPPLQKGETKENPPLQKGETKENPPLQKGETERFENSPVETGRVMVFVNPHWSIGPLTDDGLIANSENNNEGQNEPKTILDQFTLAIKASLDKLGLAFKDGVAQVKEFIAGKITTKKLCIEGEDGETICVEKDQLKELLNKSNNQEAPSILPAPVEEDAVELPVITPAPEPAPIPEPEPTPIITPTPTPSEPTPKPTPEIIPAPILEPIPISEPTSAPAETPAPISAPISEQEPEQTPTPIE